jgi:hybrid polyketide synthase/nonribosomal peptide synthetase ACE1
MRDIGRKFDHYTFTDISTGFFENAQDVFASVGDKMTFKTLNIEKDIDEQGYEEHSYDLVVASLVLHATADLHQTLTNARRLLKPGGYLIMQEVSNNDVSRVGFFMCAMPGWWLGKDDGRKLSPCVSTLEWNRLLLQSGFSGVDSATHELDHTPFPLTVIVSQAIDDRISFLRDPLSSTGIRAGADEDWDLVLLGGQKPSSAEIIDQIIALVQLSGIKHTVFKSISELDTTKLTAKSAVLCLTELDEPVFENLSEQTLVGLQRLFETQRTVLWITQGCRSENPWMNSSVGLGRSLVLENPDLVLQFLDLQASVAVQPRLILEALLRLRQSDAWEKEGDFDNVLWANEHELAYENGELTIPRVYHSEPLNDRYNTSKRTVVKSMDPQTALLSLTVSSSGRPSLILNHHKAIKGSISVKVSHSLLLPVLSTPLGSSYLLLGTNKANDKLVVAISATNGSSVYVKPENLVENAIPAGFESRFLSKADIQFQAENVFSIVPKGSTLLVHEPSPELASSIAEGASAADIKVFFTTSLQPPINKSWISIDAYSAKRIIRSSLPSGISIFVDCSISGSTGSLLTSYLPRSCLKTTYAGIQALQHIRGFSSANLSLNLGSVIRRALKQTSDGTLSGPLPTLSLETLINQSEINVTGPAVVDWSISTEVPVQISTIDSQASFRGDRTYVLFGLTSDLAQSICDWMASHGARNIVLTSRTPKIDNNWVELLAKAGVRLEVFAK